MLLHISLSLCLLVVYIHSAATSEATSNITITSSPKLGADTLLCLNESVVLTCHTDQSVANITWRWSNQSEHGETITVIAELTEVIYTCIVRSDDDGKDIGQASITIMANGSTPIVTRENFRYYISRTEGSNLTLTTTITSNLSISSGYPVWKVLHDQPLPSTAKVINYTIDGVIYSNLSLYDLSYYDDTGNYTCTASNECGTSSVFTFIEVTKAPIMCNNSGSVAISLHDVTITVQGDFVQISCIFTRTSSKPITSDSNSLTLEWSNKHGNSWIIGISAANSIVLMLIIILLIVRSRCPTLFAGSNSLTNDHSTEPDDGDVPDGRPLLGTFSTDNPTGDYIDILNWITPNFTAHGNMKTLLPYLQKHKLITNTEEYHLKNIMHSPDEINQMLLSYLKKKGDESLQKFLCCLNLAHEHIGHKEVADELKRAMLTKQIDYNDFCSDDCEQTCS